MGSSKETAAHLRAENEELRRRLEEAEQTLDAIRSGEVDALVVSGAAGEQVFTLKGADYAYRSLVENMSEGAATLNAEGTILYCNKRLAEMLQMSLEQMVTSAFRPLVSPPNYRVFDALFQRAGRQVSKGELNLMTANGLTIPVNLSLNVLKLEETPVTVVIATDLTQQKVLGEMVAAEQLAASITDQANEAILVCDENGQIIRASTVATDLCGVDPLFKQFEDVFRINVTDSNSSASPRTGAESLLRFNDLLKGRGISQSECTLPCPHLGKKLNLLVSAGPLRDTISRTIGCVIILTNITERKKAEETIKRQLSEITSYYDNAPIGLAILDTDLRFIRINNMLSEVNGIPAAEHIGKTVKEILPSLESLAREVTSEIIKTGKAVTNIEFAGETQAQPGVERIWLESWYPQKDGDEKITGFTVMVQEITERKRLEEELRASEARYRLLAEHTKDMVWLMDMNLKTVYLSPSTEKVSGFTQQERMELTMEQSLTPESLKLASDLFLKELLSVEADPDYNPTRTLELEYYCKDGTTRWTEDTFSVIRDKNGKPEFILAEARDITERNKAEETLRESESRLRRFYESGLIGVLYWNMSGQIVEANDKFLDMVGYSRDDLTNGRIDWIDMTPPEYRHLDDDSVVELKATGINKKPFEKEYIRKDGTRIPIVLAGAMLDEERFNGVAFVMDITERKKAERTIKQQREEYRTIFDAVRPMITYLDKEGVIQRINKSGADTVNLTPQEIVGKTLHAFFPAAEADKFTADNNKVITSGEPIIGSIIEYTLPSGRKRWAQIDRIPYFDENGDVTGIIMFGLDITRRKLAEDNLEKSYESLKKALDSSIDTMVKIVEMRDPYTAGHQQRVADLATTIARAMKLEDTRIEQIRMAAVIHDIGKMYVPSDILSKPGRLSDIEFNLIKTHAQGGYDIVKGMAFPNSIAKAILQHHERLDGSGYPNQLKGMDMLLEAKILAVADVVEAMSSHRPYRSALGIDKALEEILKNSGKLYDPEVVQACLELFNSGRFEFNSF